MILAILAGVGLGSSLAFVVAFVIHERREFRRQDLRDKEVEERQRKAEADQARREAAALEAQVRRERDDREADERREARAEERDRAINKKLDDYIAYVRSAVQQRTNVEADIRDIKAVLNDHADRFDEKANPGERPARRPKQT